ncbi:MULTISPECIES: hypothetical protein [unclassified Wenzhouxiangella]|uniref:hypothetical protein n=1 Tax=unclassified Wenzhouxiangella TaxID=2613841 RepID=UPI000E32A750|nr:MULTISPECIES: hypothetical protein [unclassified Wenzhouxiangella]RFF27922.1 hypothetical protein DZK25_05480 [Wenzhouxiangella sp. 15181]
MYLLKSFLALLLGAACFVAATVHAQVPDSFMRLAEDAEGDPQSLQVALAHYRDQQGRTLHLVGAIHVADRSYFKDLQRRFDDYEVVLYEMVGDPDGKGERPAGTGLNLVGLLQGGMKDALGLAFQLEEIDYDRPNFVHADMTATEFSDSMTSRNESWMGTFMQMWAASTVSQDAAKQQAQVLRVLFASDRQLALKRMMAESMIDQARVMEVLADEDGSVLITERNRKALTVLGDELDDGASNVALFYGAGHLPDFHRRLDDEFGFELQNIEWLDAWDLGDA